MKITFLFFCFLFIAPIAAAKKTILIDQELKKYDEAIKIEENKCLKITNIFKQTDCMEALLKDPKRDSMRGTEQYCQNHYLKKSFKERETILKRLKSDQKKARNYGDRGISREPGEVTAEMLQTELMCVESSLARDQKRDINKTGLKLFGR